MGSGQIKENHYKVKAVGIDEQPAETRGIMLAKAQKWGNSLAVRLPKTVAEECGITVDSAIEISRQDDVIIIKPVKKKFSLETLLAGVTAENLHSEVLTGKPQGKELL